MTEGMYDDGIRTDAVVSFLALNGERIAAMGARCGHWPACEFW